VSAYLPIPQIDFQNELFASAFIRIFNCLITMVVLFSCFIKYLTCYQQAGKYEYAENQAAECQLHPSGAGRSGRTKRPVNPVPFQLRMQGFQHFVFISA